MLMTWNHSFNWVNYARNTAEACKKHNARKRLHNDNNRYFAWQKSMTSDRFSIVLLLSIFNRNQLYRLQHPSNFSNFVESIQAGSGQKFKCCSYSNTQNWYTALPTVCNTINSIQLKKLRSVRPFSLRLLEATMEITEKMVQRNSIVSLSISARLGL